MTKQIPIQLYYAYFRFYIDFDDIKVGLDQYCKEWQTMSAIGYNYQEYKCFVDDIGGFEHWVGDMSGYISPTRESGFIDGSPSDNVYDSSLLMGKVKIIIPDLLYLHFLKPPCGIIFRKITADAVAAATIKYTFAPGQALLHKYYAAYDTSTIELYTYSHEIVDGSSNVTSAEYTIDIKNIVKTLTNDPASTCANPEKGFNGNFDDYASFTNGENLYIDLGVKQDIFNICYKYYLSAGSSSSTTINVYYGDTVAGATNLIDTDLVGQSSNKTVDKTTYRNLNIQARFIRINVVVGGMHTGSARLYNMLID